MATAKTQALYDVHPGVAMVQKWLAELKEQTGRSMEEWLALVKKEVLATVRVSRLRR